MGLYNFQARFVPFILDGRKTHTIRALRKIEDKPGSTMHLYTGLRQKGAKLLMRAKCLDVQYFSIRANGTCIIEGTKLDDDEREFLARSDGFKDWAEMKEFWKGRLPFAGKIYHWQPANDK